MKPPSIKSVLLVSALLAPSLRAQDAPAKIHEIEQKVLQKQYREAVHELIGSAQEAESGASDPSPDLLDKHLQWLAVVGGQIGAEERIEVVNREDMSGSAGTINDLAWNMITSADAGARHPDIALKLADIALELGRGNPDLEPQVRDTRARALFLLGKRDEAIAEQEKSVAAAAPEDRAGFEATLAAYRKGGLPEGTSSAPAGEDTEATLASKDIRSSMDEILDLQRRIEAAEKENSATARESIDGLKDELRERQDELERFAELQQANREGNSSGVTHILAKLRTIVIPSVAFEDTTLEEAVDFLRKRSIELDTTELDPARKGLNFVVRPPVGKSVSASGKGAGEAEVARIKSLQLRNVPLSEALRYICDATRMRYKVDDFAVTLVDPNGPEDLFNRTFTVPPNFGSSLVPIQELLKLCGVRFGDGASAVLTPAGRLVVRNTPTELDKIEMLIEADGQARANRGKAAEPDPAPVKRIER